MKRKGEDCPDFVALFTHHEAPHDPVAPRRRNAETDDGRVVRVEAARYASVPVSGSSSVSRSAGDSPRLAASGSESASSPTSPVSRPSSSKLDIFRFVSVGRALQTFTRSPEREKRAAVENPAESQPQPPFPPQEQEPPGLESEMRPRPDFGEDSYRGSGKLEGRAALVTGADSGIGRAVALAFAREGADVLVSYLEEHSDAEETVRVVQDSGRRGVAIAGDVGDPEHCRALVGRAVSEFGRLDILVNNAAYQMSHDEFTDIPADEIEFVFRTNILSHFWLSQAAVPHMQPGATIINTASIQAYQPSPNLLHYATTKGAQVTFTKGLAQALAERGIRVNAVAPGPIWTPLVVMSMDAEKTSSFGEQTPLGRAGQPAELAPLYVFLASDDSSYIAGEVIGVTGGKPLS